MDDVVAEIIDARGVSRSRVYGVRKSVTRPFRMVQLTTLERARWGGTTIVGRPP